VGKVIDLTGKKFGRLIVIKRTYPNGKYGHLKWLCKCKCGTEKIVWGNNLIRDNTKSCGCLYKETSPKNCKILPSGVSNMRAIIGVYKDGAKKRGYNYDLTEEQFKEITQRDCYYCGAKPNNVSKRSTRFGDYIYNGLDRIDNEKGYIFNNVVSCCKFCNQAKSNFTLQEFKDWVERVYTKLIKGHANYVLEEDLKEVN